MSRGTVSSQSVAPATGVPVSTDAFIRKHLDETRQQVKFVEISTHLVTLFTIALSYLLIAAVVDHWVMPLGSVGRALALLVLIGGMGYYIYQFVLPLLMRKINPLYAARAIEKAEPSLKNSLINFLQLRQESGSVPQVVLNAMESRAANDIASTHVENAVDRRQLLMMGYVLAGVIALVGIYRIASAKNPFTSFYRVLIPWASVDQPSRVQIEDIEPGDTVVRHGKTVEVTALIRNLRNAEEATLYYSTSDGQILDQAIPLTPTESGLYFSTTLPSSGDGIQQAATYRIEAGDVVTRDYAIDVQPNPTILLEEVTLDFPSYTKREKKVLSRQGDIRAVEGTRVTLVANTNSPIKEAYLQLEGTDDGKPIKRRVKMKAGDKTATHTFYLELKPDRTSARYSTYRLDFSNVDGQRSTDSVTHHIYVLPDLDPEVEILNPEKSRTEVPVDGMQTIEVRALDPDFGLRRVVLRAVAGGDELFTEELFSDPTGAAGQQTCYFQFSPRKYRLQPGDVVSLHARAEDNRVNVLEKIPAPNSQRTPIYSLVITEPTKTADPSGQPGDVEPPKKNPPPKFSHPNNRDPNNRDPKNRDPNNSDPNNSDPNNSDPNNSDPNSSDPNNSDPKSSDPKSGDPSSENGNNDQTNDETNTQSGDKPDSSDDNSKSDPGEKPESGDTANNQTGSGSNDDSQGTEGSNGNGSQSGDQEAGSEGDSPNDSAGGSNDGTGNSKSSGSPNGNNGANDSDGNTGSDPAGGSQSDSQSGSVGEGKGSGEAQHPGEKFEEILEHMKKNGRDRPNPGAGSSDSSNENSTQRPAGDTSGDPNSENSGVQPKDGGPQAGDPNGSSPTDPETGNPETGNPETGNPETGNPETGNPETGNPETGNPETGNPETGNPENQGSTGSGDPRENSTAGNSTSGNSPTGSEGGNKPKDSNGGESPESTGGNTGNKPDPKKPNGESNPDGTGNSGTQPQPNSQKTNSGEGANGGTPPTDAENKPQGNGSEGEEKGPQGNGDEGKPGGGDKGEGNSGSTPSEENEDRNKSGSKGSGNNGPQDPSSPNSTKKQSSSEGDASGDKKGGGKKGDGQSAGQKGNENAGSNSPNDQGANAANEPGNGETGSQGGTQQKSDYPTGTPGNEKGNGTQSRPASDGDTTKPGQEEPTNDGSNEGANGDSPSKSGQPRGSQDGKHTQQTSDGQPGGGGNSVGDEIGNGDVAPDGSLVPDGEAANLDYTRKATDMAIDYLEDQKHNPDPELLKKMNWSKDDLSKFVDKWKQLKNTAVDGEKGKREYDETLRGLGLREQKSTRRNSGSDADSLRGLSESGHQTKPPSQYQDLFRAFKKGTARAN